MSDPSIFVMHIAYKIGVYGIAALSLNIEYGYTGLSNFGKAAFLMIGAYTAAIALENGLHPVIAIILSTAISGIIGLLASTFTLKFREDYLAITLLAFAEIARLIIRSFDDSVRALTRLIIGMESYVNIFGGVHGKVVRSFISIIGDYRLYNIAQLCLAYGFLLSSYIFIKLLLDSPYGRILRAIREDELASQTLGKETWRYKLQVIVLGSMLAGLAGALIAQFEGYISPESFQPHLTFAIWMMVILGGVGNNLGVILGAALVESIEAAALFIKGFFGYLPLDPVNMQWIFVGISIILVIAFKPKGLLEERPIKTPAMEVSIVGSTRD